MEKTTKKAIKFFSIADYEKEQEYLREMHKSGWKLVSVTGFCVYKFEKCTPEDVIYQLDYNQEGLADKDEYVKMFTDCGWEYIQDYVDFSYFRKPASQTDGAEEIFCDDASRMQLVERIFRGRVVPLLALFFAVLLPGLLYNIVRGNTAIVVLFAAVIVLYLAVFAMLAVSYYKMRRK